MLPRVDSHSVCHPLTAMPYSEALYHLRQLISIPWRSSQLVFDNVTHYTVRGLKSTFLSWASQLRLDPEARRLQGHHKDPLQSTRLYSRDDVNGSIFIQQSIVTQVIGGWRPHTPLGRGGHIPLKEPQVMLESFKKEAPERNWSFFAFNAPIELVIQPEQLNEMPTPEESSSSSDSSSDSSPQLSRGSMKSEKTRNVTTTPLPAADEVEMGLYRNTVHIIMDWGQVDTPHTSRTFLPGLQH